MTTSPIIRLLYLGRNKKLLHQIEEMLHQEIHRQTAALDGRALELVHVTSQKHTLDEIRVAPPHGLLIEIEQGRSNRNRFCQVIRGRLPRVQIVAIHKGPVDYEFVFDGYIERPLQETKAAPILSQIIKGGRLMYLRVNDLHLDIALRLVDGPCGRHQLPPKLCKLLQVLMENAGKVVKREALMQQVWDTVFLDDTRTLDVHIRWLRERIESDPSKPVYLHTVRGKGYQLLFSAPGAEIVRA